MQARNKTTLIATVMAALLCCAGQAQADTFTVDFSGTLNQANPLSPPLGTPLVVDLEITTAGDASSPESITGITGTILGKAVSSFQSGISAAFWFDGTTSQGHFSSYGLYAYTSDGLWNLQDTRVIMGGPIGNSGYISSPATNIWTIAPMTAPVPEPGTMAMLLAGLGVLGLKGRRQTSRRAAAHGQIAAA